MTDLRLRKDEILRGYEAFKKVYNKSRVIEAKYLKCYIQYDNEKGSPHITKVGFTVSKKLVKEAYKRNRIKRLQKEAYRNEKSKLLINGNNILIFNIKNDKKVSVEHLYRNGFRLFTEDMLSIFGRINKEKKEI